MTTQTARPLPIGYYLKRADELLTQRSNQALNELQLTRFDWQALNTVSQAGTVSEQDLFSPLQAFVDQSRFDDIVKNLINRSWIQRTTQGASVLLHITDEGRANHQIALEKQNAVRTRAMNNISESDYNTVIRVLETLVRNLE